MLAGFAKSVSHQEIERILSEVEAWYQTAHDQAGQEWLPLAGITNFLFMDLGYEDMDEFEDAIQGSFPEFLGAFPHIDTRQEEEKWFLRVNKVEPSPPRRLICSVTSAKQLVDTTFMQAPDAEVEIPAIEFRIGGDQRRRIDFLYNHIATAHHNLEEHSQLMGKEGQAEEADKVMLTVEALSHLLDVEEPFELIVHDPSGLSEFHPMDAVRIEETGEAASSSAAVRIEETGEAASSSA